MATARIDFDRVLETLLQTERPFPARYLTQLSDLGPDQLQRLLTAWPQVPSRRQHKLLTDLAALAERDTLVSFDDLGRALLTDPDGGVRLLALRLLDECDDPKLVPVLIGMLTGDLDPQVRLAAADALGRFVELGELEKIPAGLLQQVEQALLEAIQHGDLPVRRMALESLGYSSRPEVPPLIEQAVQRTGPEWAASALVAIGRSSDDRWEETVLSRLLDVNGRVQLAAVRSAGELGLKSARPILLSLLDEDQDDEIIAAVIWSLSQIGGEEALVVLEAMLDACEDDELAEYLETALENLAFTEDMERFDLLSLDTDAEP